MNQINLIGRLGKDPETKTTNNGGTITTFPLATTERYKSGNEQKQDTDWHNCVAFGKMGEVMAQYLKKGGQVFISGTQKHNKLDGENGPRYFAQVKVNSFEFVGGNGNGNNGDGNKEQSPQDDEAPF